MNEKEETSTSGNRIYSTVNVGKIAHGEAGRQARGLYLNLGAGVTYHRLGRWSALHGSGASCLRKRGEMRTAPAADTKIKRANLPIDLHMRRFRVSMLSSMLC